MQSAKSISTHTLTWSVTPLKSCNVATILISTHTLTWSVTGHTNTKHYADKYFNSHAHVERDNADETKFQEIVNFNSHAHVERDFKDNIPFIYRNDFNSHAHVERDP